MPAESNCLPPWRTVADLARESGKSRQTIHRWIVEGVRGPTGNRVTLDATRFGGTWGVRPADWRAFLAALDPRAESTAEPSPKVRYSAARTADLDRQTAAALDRLRAKGVRC